MKSLDRYFRGLLYHVLEKTAALWPDKLYIQLRWKACGLKYPLNLKEPRTFNEKLQWLKLYDRNPLYTKLVDKYLVKSYIANRGGVRIIPTLGVYDRFEDIDFTKLPNQFVLKTTHDSGTVIICKDKKTFDRQAARKRLNKRMKEKYWLYDREWPYKNVHPRIIAEQFMVDESGYELKDYKWFCFAGEPKYLFIATERENPNEETKFDFFDMDFNHLPITNGHPNATKPIAKPKGFDEMKEIARNLSQGMPHVRVDLYDINGEIYFGELTFCHWGGWVSFKPEEWDYKFGELIELPEKITSQRRYEKN